MNLRIKFKNFVLIVLMLFVNFQNFIAQDALKDFKTGADQPEEYLQGNILKMVLMLKQIYLSYLFMGRIKNQLKSR